MVVAVSAWLAACGPGLETIHESNLRFEHCYRLDMDPRIAASHREYCWRDWNQTYAGDQPLDRIEYARRRISTLESGDSRPVSIRRETFGGGRVFEEMDVASPTSRMAAPAPTSAHAPPPKTEPAPPQPEPVVGGRPGDACAVECNNALAECKRPCETKPGDCEQRCPEEYRGCMRRCFD
jgi:hypothetical protein